MKFSKHVETCFVRANDDFDDKLTYIYCFLNKKELLDKNPQKRTLCNGLITPSWLPIVYPMTYRWLLDNFLITAWQLSADSLMTFLWLPDKYLTIVCEVCPMTSRIVLPIAYKQKLYNVLIRQPKNWKLHLKYKWSSRHCFNPLWVPTMGAVDLSARKKKHFSSHHCAMYARIRSWPFFMDAIV